MRRIGALVTLAAIFVAGSAVADPWGEWAKRNRDDIDTTRDGIEKLVGYRDVACPGQIAAAKIAACEAAYNAIIWRRKAEKAELELMLAAVALSPVDRDRLLKIVPDPEFRAFDKRTTAKFAEVWNIFPAPEQAAPPTQK
jgi:hypothetical protein